MVRTTFITSGLLIFNFLCGGADTNSSFSVQQRDGISWLTRPDGQRFFSLGVCVVNQGVSRSFNSTNPGYAAFQYYGTSNRWAETTLQRLKSWNFTTVGGWSDYPALQQCHDS